MPPSSVFCVQIPQSFTVFQVKPAWSAVLRAFMAFQRIVHATPTAFWKVLWVGIAGSGEWKSEETWCLELVWSFSLGAHFKDFGQYTRPTGCRFFMVLHHLTPSNAHLKALHVWKWRSSSSMVSIGVPGYLQSSSSYWGIPGTMESPI